MTKAEAIEIMNTGEKVTHEYFADDEWMTMDNGKILTEEGYRHDADEFWRYRTTPGWDTNYELFKN